MPNLTQLPPPDLTPWTMFQSADLIVRIVMIGLIAASVVTWTSLLAKAIELAGGRRELRRALGLAHREPTLAGLARRVEGVSSRAAVMAAGAQAELDMSDALPAQ